MGAPIVYFDLESGGLELYHPLIQLAAVAVQDGEIIDQFESKLLFDVSLCDPDALEINGFSAEAWKEAEQPSIVATRFSKWLSPYKCINKISKAGKSYRVVQLAGYNAAVFDAPRLQEWFRREGTFLCADYRVLDVMQLVMWYFQINPEGKPDSIKLSSICEFFDIPLINAHDALADVIATACLAQKVGELMTEHIIRKFAPVNHEAALAAQRIELERWR
jgi:DNA polymerase III subunit epsilon